MRLSPTYIALVLLWHVTLAAAFAIVFYFLRGSLSSRQLHWVGWIVGGVWVVGFALLRRKLFTRRNRYGADVEPP
jgi:hypothetical protein